VEGPMNLTIKLSAKFKSRFDEISAVHNFEFGNEFEVAICESLREFLPEKFGICRGYAVSKDGEKAGDDIIIYDAINFPTLKFKKRNDFSSKEEIPIEAIYAYIEAKHTVDINLIRARL
jgi:hypothetical protein